MAILDPKVRKVTMVRQEEKVKQDPKDLRDREARRGLQEDQATMVLGDRMGHRDHLDLQDLKGPQEYPAETLTEERQANLGKMRSIVPVLDAPALDLISIILLEYFIFFFQPIK